MDLGGIQSFLSQLGLLYFTAAAAATASDFKLPQAFCDQVDATWGETANADNNNNNSDKKRRVLRYSSSVVSDVRCSMSLAALSFDNQPLLGASLKEELVKVGTGDDFGYVDFAVWQRELLKGKYGDRLFNYWNRHLNGYPKTTVIPGDRVRSGPPTKIGSNYVLPFPPDLGKKVQAAAREMGTTTAGILLAATFALVIRATGQTDAVIGMPMGGRTRSELDNIIGDFVNVLPLRVKLNEATTENSGLEAGGSNNNPATESSSSPSASTATTFQQLVTKHVKNTLLSGLMHQEYPFSQIVSRLQQHRDISQSSPIFQMMLVHEQPTTRAQSEIGPFILGDEGGHLELTKGEGAATATGAGAELSFDSMKMQEKMVEYDLVFVISEGDNGHLTGRLQYATDCYEAKTAESIGSQWLALLENAVTQPSTPISKLDILSSEAKEAVMTANKSTTDRFPELMDPNNTMLDLFESAAKKFSSDPAIIRSEEELKVMAEEISTDNNEGGPRQLQAIITFNELDVMTNRIASAIRSQALPNLSIACLGLHDTLAPTLSVFAPRGCTYLVSLVAALKTGLPYTPIDTTLGGDRIKYILKDSASKVVLCARSAYSRLVSLLEEAECKETDQNSVTHVVIVDDLLNPRKVVEPEEEEGDDAKTAVGNTKVKKITLSTSASSSSSSPSRLECYSSSTPMYTIYTSGSTGTPKGVMVHHRAAMNTCLWLRKAHGVRPAVDRSCQCLGAAFDPVTVETWPFWISGAAVITLPNDVMKSDLENTVDFLFRNKISHITFPTAMSMAIFDMIDLEKKVKEDSAANGGPNNFSLRVWSCGGDRFKGTKKPMPFTIANAYGPTETAVQCSQYYLNFDPPAAEDTTSSSLALRECRPPEANRVCEDPPIGGPTANTSFYVLDSNMNLVPPGAIGELWVGGAQVSLGYRNRPEQTADSFRPDPFGLHSEFALPRGDEGDQKWMYRTGDLVRVGENNNYYFWGRKDFQVKLRGYRIELGEIEDQLTKCPEVRSACVVVHSTDVDKYLVGYVLLTQSALDEHNQHKSKSSSTSTGDAASAEAKEDATKTVGNNTPVRQRIKEQLTKKLPSYMVPALEIAESLTLTVNGKIDRHRLPPPTSIEEAGAGSSSSAGGADAAPKTDTEKKVCGIWEDLLHTKNIGTNENWYSRGGTSLTSTLLLSKMRQVFQMEIVISQFNANPTVASLAKIVEEKGHSNVAENLTDTLLADAFALPSNVSGVDLTANTTVQRKEDLFNPETHRPTAVLLTGVTGFLGAFIAAEILRSTDCILYCLVRAKTEADASKRVVDNLKNYQLVGDDQALEQIPPAVVASRVVAVVGDLGKPLFGLTSTRWNELAQCIDSIVHNGALVNFGYPYVSLRPPNVDGTITVLSLAATTKIKPVHFISTLSVLPAPKATPEQIKAGKKIVISEDPLDISANGLEGVSGGYTQTKWVAEALVELARSRGIPATIFRPGRITGHSLTGATNVDDFLNLLIKGSVQMGVGPDLNMPCEMTPVDYCSKAIVEIALKPMSKNNNNNNATAGGLSAAVSPSRPRSAAVTPPPPSHSVGGIPASPATGRSPSAMSPAAMAASVNASTAPATPPYYWSWAQPDEPYVYHLTNPSALSFQEVFSTVCGRLGFGSSPNTPAIPKLVPFKIWRHDHLLQLTHESHNSLLPLVPMFGEDFEEHMDEGSLVSYGVASAQAALAKKPGAAQCPPTSIPLVENYAHYFMEVGFLKPAPTSS